MTGELLPTRVAYGPGDDVAIEVRDVQGVGTLTIRHLGDVVAEVHDVVSGVTSLGRLPPGGYGVEWRSRDLLLRTAVDVRTPDDARVRYGFTASYLPGREPGGFADNLRRLHLTDVQFYDWAFRHADLLGGGAEYSDALGQPISLDTVAQLVTAVHRVGAKALGYAAVYGVGDVEWDSWRAGALLDASGDAYSLGDFLRILDPAWGPWLEHFCADLRGAAERLGFDGFHLDQYGYPKLARRADGVIVDLADSFAALIGEVRRELPASQLIFNNVNDFPSYRTGSTPQNAVYIEVWEPNTSLDDLADLVARARAHGDGKPVVIAAYQHAYDSAPAADSDRAAALTMATLFSHGAAHLLAGEEDRILVDPYYVRNHEVAPSTAVLLKDYADFVVEHDELLLDPRIVDVTASMAGAYNDDLEVDFGGLPLTNSARAGAVWRRITRVGDRFVIHLINLSGCTETGWGTPKPPSHPTPTGRLRIRTLDGALPQVRIAEPGRSPFLESVEVTPMGTHAHADLPPVHTWQIAVVDLTAG
jgi:dextranase